MDNNCYILEKTAIKISKFPKSYGYLEDIIGFSSCASVKMTKIKLKNSTRTNLNRLNLSKTFVLQYNGLFLIHESDLSHM